MPVSNEKGPKKRQADFKILWRGHVRGEWYESVRQGERGSSPEKGF